MKNPWSGLRELPASLWLLFAATLINRLGTMVLAFLALYLTRTQGYTPTQAGAMLALYGTVAIFAAPLSGRICDRFGALPVIVAGLLSNGIVLLLYPFAHGPWIGLATFAMAATNETTRPASLAAVTTWSAAGRAADGLRPHPPGDQPGGERRPALGGFLVGRSFHFLFTIDASTSLAAGLVLLLEAPRLGLTRRAAAAPASPTAVPAAARSPYLDRRFLLFLAVNLLVTVGVFPAQLDHAPLPRPHPRPLSGGLRADVHPEHPPHCAIEVPLNGGMAEWPLPAVARPGCPALRSGLRRAGARLDRPWSGGDRRGLDLRRNDHLPHRRGLRGPVRPRRPPGGLHGRLLHVLGRGLRHRPWAGTRILEAFGGGAVWTATFLCGAVAAVLYWLLPSQVPAEV